MCCWLQGQTVCPFRAYNKRASLQWNQSYNGNIIIAIIVQILFFKISSITFGKSKSSGIHESCLSVCCESNFKHCISEVYNKGEVAKYEYFSSEEEFKDYVVYPKLISHNNLDSSIQCSSPIMDQWRSSVFAADTSKAFPLIELASNVKRLGDSQWWNVSFWNLAYSIQVEACLLSKIVNVPQGVPASRPCQSYFIMGQWNTH